MFRSLLLLLVLFVPHVLTSNAATQSPPADRRTITFIGLHGGAFEQLEAHAAELGLELRYATDEAIEEGTADFRDSDLVLLQHLRTELHDRYVEALRAGRAAHPQLRALGIQSSIPGRLPELVKDGILSHDPQLARYYGSTSENARRLLIYLARRYLGAERPILPPAEYTSSGLYHPAHDGLFADAAAYRTWMASRPRTARSPGLIVVAVHSTHLLLQQPRVVDALIEALEAQGLESVAVIDSGPDYVPALRALAPDVVLHTCHSRDSVALREELDALHVHSVFFRKLSIEQWRASLEGLAPNELAFHMTGQEPLGQIEPLVGAGTLLGGGTAEDFTPIDERIGHIARRVARWTRLRHLPNDRKKLAVIYWDREMGKAELMRGSATGMFLNGPRSLVRVLHRLRERGYAVDPVPQDEAELVGWLMERGRQIGLWAPETLDRAARSGAAELVPVARYEEWYRTALTETQRQDVEKHWGPAPGEFMAWTDPKDGQRYFVIPRIELGNVVLLPQPLRGEAHDARKLHDKLVPPPHNYIATYLWLQRQSGVDALVHFGTHGSEFLLPGKPTGLSQQDWPDTLIGDLPNLNPWVINNLGESLPARRRPYAVVLNHLVPPSVQAELSDELANLHADIHKWSTMADGALRTRFAEKIAGMVRELALDTEIDITLEAKGERDGAPVLGIDAEQIEQLTEYLHEIHDETTPISLHVLGETPPDELLVPWVVTCLASRFLDELGQVLEVPAAEAAHAGDRESWLRAQGEALIAAVALRGQSPIDALAALAPHWDRQPSERLAASFAQAERLLAGFRRTGDEVEQLLRGLSGRFVPPGPGNSPERNPGVLPTGRNMYVLNPEEVPSRPSWEIGQRLVDQLLEAQIAKHGRYPRRIAFTLNSMATFMDYGVMEAQILYLLGVRPIWDERQCVQDVELIPAHELGRPRIDVFLSVLGYYRDMLPSRMQLLDRAVQLVATLDEKDNLVHAHSEEAFARLTQRGVPKALARTQSRGRIFGRAPGEMGSAGYYYLVERSADWDTREDLVAAYLEHSRSIYTQELWGVEAKEAYAAHVQKTDVLLRSWSDRTRSPLSNKYDWYKAGSLSLAIEQLTGQRPEWFFSDVRDVDRAKMVGAEEALHREFRVRLFNRKWIEGMMREGYAGADQIAVHVSNASGWAIMRSGSVPDTTWNEIFDVYVRDEKQLGLRAWFERENAFAFQELTEILLEAARKGDWHPDPARLAELATAYTDSVAAHGEGGGLRGARNTAMRDFARAALPAAALAAASSAAQPAEASVRVEGQVLEPESESADAGKTKEADAALAPERGLPPWLAAAACLALILVGFLLRTGPPR